MGYLIYYCCKFNLIPLMRPRFSFTTGAQPTHGADLGTTLNVYPRTRMEPLRIVALLLAKLPHRPLFHPAGLHPAHGCKAGIPTIVSRYPGCRVYRMRLSLEMESTTLDKHDRTPNSLAASLPSYLLERQFFPK